MFYDKPIETISSPTDLMRSFLEQRRPTVLIVDDELNIRRALARQLTRQGFEVHDAGNGAAGIALIQEHRMDIALIDLKMPDMSGHEVLREFRNLSPATECIVITAHGSAEAAYLALSEGAYDYFEKPIMDSSRFFQILRKALEVRDLKEEKSRLQAQLGGDSGTQLIGNSPAMIKLNGLIRDVARVPVPVLITGESGTGKERVARAIHQSSPQADGPWVAINCTAIPENLLESELFGYEKGAFTGAQGRKHGLFEEASGGTLFLDEIGNMPISMQAKLLRVLQEREIVRVGSSRSIPINCRILAATHVGLKEAIAKGDFREDLYYRLNVINIQVPPLRDRAEDIQLLTYFFVQKFNQEYAKNVRSLSSEALELLQSQEWKENNVRQLENAINRAMVLCQADELGIELFNLAPGRGTSLQGPMEGSSGGMFDERLTDMDYTDAKREVVEAFSRWYLEDRLRETGWNITRAAEMSGQQRPNFRKLMTRFGVDVPSTSERQRQFKQS
jgi:DNA-binding NtrC family response regulator